MKQTKNSISSWLDQHGNPEIDKQVEQELNEMETERTRTKLDSYSYHELMDRLSVVTQIVDNQVQQHSVAKIEPRISGLISEAVDKLTSAYQLAGQESFNKHKQENQKHK